MTALHLFRHGKAVAQDSAGDRARPLDEAGRRAVRAMADWMRERGVAPALVLCSDATRTRQTLEVLLPAFAPAPQIVYEEGLYLASPQRLLARLRKTPPATSSVLLVGHNPGLHELAAAIMDVTSGPLAARVSDGFPTAALASYELAVPWSALDRRGARLIAYMTPKDLPSRLA